jgi:hypothetical protein
MSWCSLDKPNLEGTITLASNRTDYEISQNSLDAPVINQWIEDAKRYPGNFGAAELTKLKIVDDIDYESNFSVAISSSIKNYFN